MSPHQKSVKPDERNLTTKQEKGRNLEMSVTAALLMLFGSAEYNPYDDEGYAKAQGKYDHCIRRLRMFLEAKNWSKFVVTPSMVREEILSRYPKLRRITRVLIISTLEGFTPEALRLLRIHRVHAIELRREATWDDWEAVQELYEKLQTDPIFTAVAATAVDDSYRYSDVFLGFFDTSLSYDTSSTSLSEAPSSSAFGYYEHRLIDLVTTISWRLPS